MLVFSSRRSYRSSIVEPEDVVEDVVRAALWVEHKCLEVDGGEAQSKRLTHNISNEQLCSMLCKPYTAATAGSPG